MNTTSLNSVQTLMPAQVDLPVHFMELEQIYAATLARGVRSLCLAGPTPGTGVSTLARALAQRNCLAGHSTLLVDMNLYHPQLTEVGVASEGPMDDVQASLALVPAPVGRREVLYWREPGVLEQALEQWLGSFDSVIFDTSALNANNSGNIPAERVAAASDGCVLVCLSGHTLEADVMSARARLQTAEAVLLGSVMNDRDQPTLLQECLREVSRLQKIWPSLANKMSLKLKQTAWLRMPL